MTLVLRICIAALLAGAAVLTAPRVMALEILRSEQTRLALEAGNGQLVRLDAPAASVLIADPAIADVASVSPNVLWVYGILPGETNVFVVDPNDNVLARLELTVTQSVRQVSRALGEVSPGGRLGVSPVGENGLLLSGQARSPSEAADAERVAGTFVPPENVINRSTIVGPTQINLRVTVAEVARDTARDLGIRFSALIEEGNFITQFTTLGLTSLPSVTGAGNLLAESFSSGGTNINSVIQALQESDLATILAEPNLTALSGQTAEFLAGGEFPIAVAQEDDTISVEFKEFGVSLTFLPTLLNDGRINLRVRPEVSTISTEFAVDIGGITIPSLITRRAETTVELASGESFAIAGLFDSRTQSGEDVVPFLGNIPIIGNLFRSDEFMRNETELVIAVTPYLVEPVNSPNDVLLPTDRLSQPTELTIGQGILGNPPSTSVRSTPDALPAFAGGRIDTQAGFILE
ncbi:MAG: type II and III secretion system protein family protein [Alphaproteobacteria bacterium]|jgi:pilus assembly protein CpaC|nr:type II and III secretion system protein family protein [Alphaproteobacteria bacterium]